MTSDHTHADHQRFVEWDAAYVFGALSPVERREFETHLEGCERCRSAVAELTGLPGLLGRLDASRAWELLEAGESLDAASGVRLAPAPVELVARIERRETQRRHRRIRVLVGLAAAAQNGEISHQQ